MASPAASLHDLFGSPDDMKFRSCMTLFDRAADGNTPIYHVVLDRWCEDDPIFLWFHQIHRIPFE